MKVISRRVYVTKLKNYGLVTGYDGDWLWITMETPEGTIHKHLADEDEIEELS